MRIDDSTVVSLVVRIALEVIKEKGFRDWEEVSKRLKENGYHRQPDTCRKIFKRSEKRGLVIDDSNVVMEIKGNGERVSERILRMSEAEMKDPEFVLKAHGFDPREWELIVVRNNMWKTQSKLGELQNYQSRVTVKPKVSYELTKEDILELVKEFKPYDIKVDIKVDEITGKRALEIDFADVHIGGLSWHEEVGYDNDYKIAFHKIVRQVTKAKRIIQNHDISKLYLCFLGDFLHVDNDGMTTTKGTKVDFDSRPKKMVQKGLEIIMYIIQELAIVPTEVIWVEGNHSRLVEFTIFNSLPHIYAKTEHIKFDVTPKLRKAFMFGENLVGLHHGEIQKSELFNWLQVEYREWWGVASYVEQHSGHYHSEKVTEKGGIIQRTNPTPKPVDLYEYQNGWVSEKTILAYVWHETEKLEAVVYLR